MRVPARRNARVFLGRPTDIWQRLIAVGVPSVFRPLITLRELRSEPQWKVHMTSCNPFGELHVVGVSIRCRRCYGSVMLEVAGMVGHFCQGCLDQAPLNADP